MGMEPFEACVSGSGKDRVYLDFYNLKESPFSITPDPEFLYFSNTHQSVIDKTLYGINNRMGFILLTGEVGTGKTTICRSILDRLDGEAEMVYIINPFLSGRELISSILDDLGIEYSPDSSKKDLIDHLNRFALSASETKPVVIIMDDAQTIPIDALEDLRLLSNLETDKKKLLQMVLVGQPELIDLISRPEIRQLRQRVVINCHLEFLTPQEVEGYIARRLFVAGDKGQVRFTHKAKQLIAKASSGIPRLINKICDYALTSGYISNDFNIGHQHVKKALAELGDLDFKKGPLNAKKIDRASVKYQRWIHLSVYGLIILVISLLAIHFLDLNIMKKKVNQPESYSNSPPQKHAAGEQTASVSIPNRTVDELGSGLSFILQFGSHKTINRTKTAFYQYIEKGIEAHWNRVDLKEQGIWYRLFTGPFANKAKATKYKNDHGLEESKIVFAPWSVLVADSAPQQKLDQIRSILRDNQIDYFTIKNTDDRYRLLAGAFVTKEGAAELAQKIIALGYDARVVWR